MSSPRHFFTHDEAALLARAPKPFPTDIEALRQRARQHMEQGAVTDSYGADVAVVVELLNAALATEIICTLRYKRHYFTASGIHAESIAREARARARRAHRHRELPWK